jgi:ankyrin repeat protein
VEFLLERGADPALRNANGQTGLHWAAYGAHIDVVKLLLQRGPPIDAKDSNFQAQPLDVALYVWDTSSDAAERERCYEVVSLLAGAGAKLDSDHWHNTGDQPGMLEKIRCNSRMSAALRDGIPAS